MCNATYLLVCATEKRHVPGKLFEYLRTGRPVIAFGDNNEEVKQILDEVNAGRLFSYKDSAKEFFSLVKSFSTDVNKVKKYDRRIIASGMSKILNLIE